jgi:hypothetical protein
MGCVGIFTRQMDVSITGNHISIGRLDNDAGVQLDLVGINGQERQVKQIPNPDSMLWLNINTLFDFMPEKLIVKLKQNDMILDMVILNNLNYSTSSNSIGWMLYDEME